VVFLRCPGSLIVLDYLSIPGSLILSGLVDQYGTLGNLVNYVTWFTSDARLLHRTGSLKYFGFMTFYGSLVLSDFHFFYWFTDLDWFSVSLIVHLQEVVISSLTVHFDFVGFLPRVGSLKGNGLLSQIGSLRHEGFYSP